MSPDDITIALIIAVFAVFGAVLLGASIYVALGERRAVKTRPPEKASAGFHTPHTA